MTHPTSNTFFFAGTDTEVGKTFAASLVASSLHQDGKRVGVYKPVASDCPTVDGALVAEDAVALWQAAGKPRTLDDVCPQKFIQPLAPPEAATAEGKTVDAALLRSGAACWEEDFDLMIVEGAGGLMSPLAHGVLNIDLVKQFDSPQMVIVAANRLGVVHQVLATTTAAIHLGVKPYGVILNQITPDPDSSVQGNAAQIERYSQVPLLGTIEFGASNIDKSLAGRFC